MNSNIFAYCPPKEQLKHIAIYKSYLKKYKVNLPENIKPIANQHLIDVEVYESFIRKDIEQFIRIKKEEESRVSQLKLFN